MFSLSHDHVFAIRMVEANVHECINVIVWQVVIGAGVGMVWLPHLLQRWGSLPSPVGSKKLVMLTKDNWIQSQEVELATTSVRKSGNIIIIKLWRTGVSCLKQKNSKKCVCPSNEVDPSAAPVLLFVNWLWSGGLVCGWTGYSDTVKSELISQRCSGVFMAYLLQQQTVDCILTFLFQNPYT